jgi:serine/threonine protein kinase
LQAALFRLIALPSESVKFLVFPPELGGNPGIMSTKRKSAASPADTGSFRKRQKSTQPAVTFIWNQRNWKQAETIADRVSILKSKENNKQLVVMKVMEIGANSGNDKRPLEIRALSKLPDCNRILKPLYFERTPHKPGFSMAIFPHCPLGDLKQWKESQFDKRMFKPVPESFIWRFFIQMSQALIFIQNGIEPRREGQSPMIHRDIKPKNILVVENGTTYPSFKLHDFGCAMLFAEAKANRPAYCGTYEWQPPENPIINTEAAEVWALGACVHYLATGKAPIGDREDYKQMCLQEFNGDPPSARKYNPNHRYYAAKVPREVTSINVPFRVRPGEIGGRPPRQYSDELNDWMTRCLKNDARKRPTTEQLIADMVPETKSMLQGIGGKVALTDIELETKV